MFSLFLCRKVAAISISSQAQIQGQRREFSSPNNPEEILNYFCVKPSIRLWMGQCCQGKVILPLVMLPCMPSLGTREIVSPPIEYILKLGEQCAFVTSRAKSAWVRNRELTTQW